MPNILDHPIVSDQITRQELVVIVRECQNVFSKGVDGDIVELGCYVGTTSLFLQRLILQFASQKALHVYDSFAGLPNKLQQDQSPVGEQFKGGELVAAKPQLIKHFKHAGLPLPVIHKAWFEDLTPTDMPDHIAFAFLDGDFYSSILASLRVVWPKLTPGAVVVVDDYQTVALPGVRRAIKEWSQNHSFTVRVEASLAILVPTR
ncbi:MAG TPA: TylF/MycF/NovP-related O-methyltransferase [Candidatus Saccharimonadales bacterium]|nr:TylF/MycF/NovP-related O-methyltransferase [Candidatus Saccharimonadales bacterium]